MSLRLRGLLPTLSLLLCIALIVLWYSSYVRYACVAYGIASSNHVVWSHRGHLILYVISQEPTEKGLSFTTAPPSTKFTFDNGGESFLGLRFGTPNPPLNWFISLPDGVLVAALALSPFFHFARWCRKVLRRRPGTCRACGYDLTANISGVCPECGTSIQPPTKKEFLTRSGDTPAAPAPLDINVPAGNRVSSNEK